MKNFSIVQAILIGVSVVAIAAALVIFSVFTGTGGGSRGGTVVLWGTIPELDFRAALQTLEADGAQIEGVQYVEKNPATFDSELLKALAEGTGPDLVLINEKQVLGNIKRMQTIPFSSFPLRTYQDMFLEESSLLVTDQGLLGFPFLVDPLVMYYNRDMLANAGYAKAPETWTEVLAVAPTLTVKDSSFNISKSTIALGSFDNVNNAKDIYWTLVLQAGNPVIRRGIDPETGETRFSSIFNDSLNFTLNPSYAATNFFTQFTNPTKTVYSWNRSLPSSQNAFVAGDLAFYLGYASELTTLKRLNPNLNFDVTLVPQSQSSTRKATYGSMYVLAIPRTSSNSSGAISVIGALTSKKAQAVFAKELEISSVRKDILATADAANPYESIFNRSAVMAQGILEPEPVQTSAILKELVDTVVSGQYEISDAIERAQDKLSLLLNQ